MIPVAVFGIAFLVNKLIHTFGLIKTILIGLTLGAIASLLQIFFTSETSLLFILVSFFILGSMWALGNTVPIIAAQTAVGNERASVATGTIVTLFNVGGSIGLTVSIVLYHSVCAYTLRNFIHAQKYTMTNAQLKLIKQFITNPADSLHIKMEAITKNIFHDTFMHGFSGVMYFLFALSVLLLLGVLWITRFEHHE